MFFKKKEKVFCISFQRTGTTSVGEFFLKHGFSVATWNVSVKNNWTKYWFEGDYESIFNSTDFKKNTVFEDNPWWCLDFYKILYHRFPKAKFILFTRDSNKWFDSMVSHSNGKTLGNTYVHCKIYDREQEFHHKFPNYLYQNHTIDNLLEIIESNREHYIKLYENRNREVIAFFNRNNNSRLILLKLEDGDKWQKLGLFFKIKVEPLFSIHANASKKI